MKLRVLAVALFAGVVTQVQADDFFRNYFQENGMLAIQRVNTDTGAIQENIETHYVGPNGRAQFPSAGIRVMQFYVPFNKGLKTSPEKLILWPGPGVTCGGDLAKRTGGSSGSTSVAFSVDGWRWGAHPDYGLNTDPNWKKC